LKKLPESAEERKRNPGRVKTTPAAMLSLALPVVWMMLFSRMVVLNNFLPRVMASTAIGIEADTVSPAFRARYTVDAPNRIPKMLPISNALKVNSFISVSGLTKGTNFFSAIQKWFLYFCA